VPSLPNSHASQRQLIGSETEKTLNETANVTPHMHAQSNVKSLAK